MPLFILFLLLVASIGRGEDSFFHPSVRSPRLGEVVYFLLPDRFNDGDPSNNTGKSASADPNENGFGWAIMSGPKEDLSTFDKRDGSHWELFECDEDRHDRRQTVKAVCTDNSSSNNCGNSTYCSTYSPNYFLSFEVSLENARLDQTSPVYFASVRLNQAFLF